MKRPIWLTLLALLACIIAQPDVLAALRTSSQTGNWSATTTWGGNPAPTAADDVIINGGFTVTVDVASAAALSLQLGGSTLGTGAGTVTFANGSHLTVSGLVTLGVTTNTPGSLNMAAGGTLTCQGFIDNRLGTWTQGTGTIELTATNTLPTNNNVDFNNLTMSGGTTTISRTLTISGNVLINPGAALDGGANATTVAGDWINNGTFTGNAGTIIFTRNGNASITGTGTNNFNLIRLNLGTSINNTLEVLATNFTAPDPFLTITNGTFKMSGSFTFANSFITGPIYNIDPNTGFWINNPNVTVTGQAAGGVSVRGMLRISAGTYNIGTAADNSLVYTTGSSIIVEGGTLNIAGRLTRNNATQTTVYTQSAGTVTVVGQGSTDPTFAGFDLGVAGSSFTMSGGTIVVRNATSAPADFVNAASVANVTGGTLQIGDANTANAQIIRVQSSRPVGNLLVSNATAQAVKPTAQLVTSSLNVVGNVTVQTGTTLNTNGLNLSLGGDWSNSGTFTSGGNTVTFNGAGAQALSATGGETFNSLAISKAGGTLTMNNSATVNTIFSLTQGTLAIGANTLTLNSIVTGGGTLTSAATGTVSYNQGSDGQTVLAGNYGNLLFSNFNKVLAPTGTIGIAGTFTAGAAVGHTVTGSTIDFNGATQTIPAFAYNNLSLSGSGTKTGSGTITVSGNLTNNAGVAFSGTTTLNLNGTTHSNAGTLSTANLAIGPGATLTNSGTTTASASLSGSGALAQAATGVLNIGGSAGITAINASAAGNTVNYSGAGQTVVAATYHHLTLSGSGTPVLAGVSTINGNFTLSGTVTPAAATGITVGGNFTIGAGTSFDAGSFSHSLKGNWSNAGTFNAGTSTFTLNGTTPQTLTASTFNALDVNNPAGVSMLGDATVGGAFTLTNGAFSIGAHTLTMNGVLSPGAGSLAGGTSSNIVVGGSGGQTTLPVITLNNLTLNRANGDSLTGDATIGGALTVTNGTLNTGSHTIILGAAGTLSEPAGQPVVGAVRTTRNVTATSGTESFGNTGVDVALNGVAPGSTTVLRKTGTASTGGGHSSIKRYFDITPTINTGLNVGLVFHYDATEVNGQNANTLDLYRSRDNGATWSNLGGTLNTVARTISVTGLNDLSRWTASDTANRIGNTATPVTISISPSTRNAGDPTFTLTVNGTDFLSGKSTVRFNGNDRTTTFVNSTQLTASIPATDVRLIGAYPVTVFNAGGGGSSNAQTLTVNPGPPSQVRVETAADGSGAIVPAQSLASGATVTVYAITRDSLNNFVSNVAATAWSLQNITGGVVAGDLVPAADGKSAVLTGHVIGSATIRATSGVLATTSSGTITVTPGTATKVRVETAANGSGTIVPAQSLTSGSAVTVYAITRDASNNFVANVAGDVWALENSTGGVVAGDLLPAPDSKSAVFTAHLSGTTDIRVTSGVLAVTPSGTITVTPGAVTKVRVETAANGSGTVVPAQLLSSGLSITGYAITRDSLNNFVANVVANEWTLENITSGVVPGDLIPAVDGKSAVFTGHAVGTADIKATSGLLATTPSGTITVIPGAAAKVRVETAANGSGTIVPAQSLASGSSLTVFAVTRDASDNFLANVAADVWSLQTVTGGVVAGDLVPAVDGRSAIFTAHLVGSATIRATSGALTVTGSGAITVTPGTAAHVRVETAANGSGTIVPAQSLGSGSSITVYAITRDALDNFVSNVAADVWSLQNIAGGVVAGDLVPAVDSRSAVFTGHGIGSATIRGTSGALTTTGSGTITVTAGAATQVRIETAANGSGTIVPAQSLASGLSITVFAITRDASSNFVSNVIADVWSLQNITGGVVAGDLVPAVDGRSAVFTAHLVGSATIRATSGALTVTGSGTITVTPGAAAQVRVETAANGSGTVVPAQALASGSSITVYAITRDGSNNFVANAAADVWSLQNVVGGVVAGDLVPALDLRSAVFTAHAVGSGNIRATSGALATTSSGTISVTSGAATRVRVETAANGSGTVVPAQSLAAGSSMTVYAITRDSLNNFAANIPADVWSLQSITGGVVAGDLVPSADRRSAVFTAHAVGSASIRATSGTLVTTSSGTITVTAGAATRVRVETAADGSGTIVAAQSLAAGSSITMYAVTRDTANNFVSNVVADVWSLQNIVGGVVAGDLVPSVDRRSAVFTAHATGSASIRATSGTLTTSSSGTITVTAATATRVRVETAANGSGTIVPAQSLAAGSSITVYAVTRDTANNFVSNAAADVWSLQNITGGVVAGDLIPSVDHRSAVFTAHVIGSANIRATSGTLAPTTSGIITVTAGTAVRVRVETSADGSGTIVPPESLASGSSITVYAITRDTASNFVANAPADTWSLRNITGSVVPGDLVPALDGRSAVFTGHGAGSASVVATSGALATTGSGTITVSGLIVAVSVDPGWNILSNPVTTSSDSIRQLYPTADQPFAFAFLNGTGYVQQYRMQNGVGYWAKFSSGATTASLSGTPRASDSISVIPRWNMIGSISVPVDTSTIVTVPPGIRSSIYFGYSAGYVPATTIVPGKGYWVKVANPGRIVLRSGPVLRKSGTTGGDPFSVLNTLTVTDSKGRSQTLYFGADGNNGIDLPMYDMPPVPPAGAFDARFETADGGSMVRTHTEKVIEGAEFPVTIQSDAYPVTITWNVCKGAASYDLTDGAGGRLFATKSMSGEGSMKITNSALARISLKVTGDGQVPNEFALAQNYPNPFNPATTIAYDLPRDTRVSLKVFNVLGQEVATLVDEEQKAGHRSMKWNAASVASGAYFYRIQAGDFVASKKLLLLK